MASVRVTASKCENALDRLHLMPCEVEYSGEACVSRFFEPCIRKDKDRIKSREEIETEAVKIASFRGRPLKGKNIDVPTSYQGLILKEERKPFTDDAERTLVPQTSFSNFTYWNLDTQPSQNDNIFKALKWIGIAKVLHGETEETDADTHETQTDR